MVPIIRVCFTKDDNSAAGDYRAPPVQASHSKAHAGGGKCFTFPVFLKQTGTGTSVGCARDALVRDRWFGPSALALAPRARM